jgi:hypothetical protein
VRTIKELAAALLFAAAIACEITPADLESELRGDGMSDIRIDKQSDGSLVYMAKKGDGLCSGMRGQPEGCVGSRVSSDACVSEGRLKAALEAHGLTEITIQRTADGFTYSARQEGSTCGGDWTVSPGGSSGSSSTCDPPVRMSTE